MAEMLIEIPEKRKVVTDYDFLFTSGMLMPITLDEAAGDSVEFRDNGEVRIHLVAKPSLNDVDKSLPAEDIIIYRQHVISYQTRQRELVQMTPEQQFEWQRTLKELTGTVN